MITNSARGVRVEDGGFGLGANTGIAINRNAFTGNSEYGVGNISAETAGLDAKCNWWGAGSGPGPVGPGTGDKINNTSPVDFSTWLGSSDLNGPCPAPTNNEVVKVTIDKFLDGVQATALNASSTAFSMHAIFPGGEGDFALGPVGFNNPNPYQAMTADMPLGSNYSTFENLATNCDAGNPYALVGYSVGDTLAEAEASTSPTTVVPNFMNLQGDKFIVVWNRTCQITPPTTLGQISGMKYNDLNRNGMKNTNEPGLAGWVIRLMSGNNVVATTTTDASGNYSFNNVSPGTYKVREIHQSGWKRMSKNPKPIVITTGSVVTDVNFGNAQKRKGEKDDTNQDDNRDDQSGNYYGGHGRSDYGNDQNRNDHGQGDQGNNGNGNDNHGRG
jgi:hypothetical protein